MAIHIDEYGHIIRDESSEVDASDNVFRCPTATSTYTPNQAPSLEHQDEPRNLHESHSPILERSIPWYGGDGVFWTITMALSVGVALLSAKIVPLAFEPNDNPDFFEEIINSISSLAPYVSFVGAILGGVLYNRHVTKKSGNSYHCAIYCRLYSQSLERLRLDWFWLCWK